MRTHRPFTSIEDDFLGANYRSMSHRDIAAHLGRIERTVVDRCAKLGLRKRKTTPFTPEEDEVIRAGVGRKIADIARELGRARAVVSRRAQRLGIPSWIKRNGHKPSKGYAVKTIIKNGAKYKRVREHRAIMEDYLGRPLTAVEKVHHINFRKRDNRIDNLYLCANDSVHGRLHWSLLSLIPGLLECGIIRFDRNAGVYVLCETSK